MVDGGIYLIKAGKPIDEPGQMLLIKNDPKYNEQWPRALVPYKRIYGVDEPKRLTPLANDGKLSPAPAGRDAVRPGRHVEPVQARELSQRRRVQGSVTATFAGGNDRTNGYRGLDPFNTSENGASLNWFNQGADAGLYTNDDIHAIRILVHGADDRSQPRAKIGPACSTTTPRSGCASSARSRSASSQ